MPQIPDEYMTFSYVETTYYIPRGTIHSRLDGLLERHVSHAHKRRLTLQQEQDLADWILDLNRRHQSPSHARCRLKAISIQRAGGSDASLGRHWLYRFFKKYHACGSPRRHS